MGMEYFFLERSESSMGEDETSLFVVGSDDNKVVETSLVGEERCSGKKVVVI